MSKNNSNLNMLLSDDEKKYQEFLQKVNKYSFNNEDKGINCGYENYPKIDQQPIQNLKFNVGYKSTLSDSCNAM